MQSQFSVFDMKLTGWQTEAGLEDGRRVTRKIAIIGSGPRRSGIRR